MENPSDNSMDISLSQHAEMRSAQRNVSFDEILFIIRHGRRTRRTGVIFCQMLEKNMPENIPANDPIQRLVGTTVVLCECGHHVVTIKRGVKSFFKDKRKSKYCAKRQYGTCPCCGSTANR
jgi:hypothetical protein